MPNLSVLITYHNEKELLTECLNSLASQSEGPEEILIYDDASIFPATDYLVSDQRIRVIRGEKNEGPSVGRNALLREAKSEYIHYHDADDWFHSEWCGKIRGALAFRNAEAVFTDVKSFNPKGDLNTERVLGLHEVSDHDSLIRFCIRRFMLVPAGTFKTAFVKKHGGYRTDLWQSEDYEFNVRMALALETFEVIQEPLVSIRLREESRSRNKIETNSYALEAILQLKSEVPRAYWNDLAEKAAVIGRQLYGLKERKKAKTAFAIARSLGPAKFKEEGPFYRLVAKWLGQETAEKIGQIYRHRFPPTLRKFFR